MDTSGRSGREASTAGGGAGGGGGGGWLDEVMIPFLSDTRLRRFVLQTKILSDQNDPEKLDAVSQTESPQPAVQLPKTRRRSGSL